MEAMKHMCQKTLNHHEANSTFRQTAKCLQFFLVIFKSTTYVLKEKQLKLAIELVNI